MAILFFLISLLAFAFEARGDFYVTVNGGKGTKSGGCPSGAPCPISELVSNAQPGEIWVLKNGTHILNSRLNINCASGSHSGVSGGSPITFQAETERGAVLDASSGDATGIFQISNCSYWTFRGLVFKDGLHPGYVVHRTIARNRLSNQRPYRFHP